MDFILIDDIESVSSEKEPVLAAAPRVEERIPHSLSDDEDLQPVCFVNFSISFICHAWVKVFRIFHDFQFFSDS